jgi:hypothetical protein
MDRTMKNRIAVVVTIAATWLFAGVVAAKLPPPTEAEKDKAAEAAAKNAWADKVAAFKLCQVESKVAAEYFADAKKAGKVVKPAVATPPCADPGPFVSAPAAATAPAPAKK